MLVVHVVFVSVGAGSEICVAVLVLLRALRVLFQAVLLVCVWRAFADFCRTCWYIVEAMLVFAVHSSAWAVQSPQPQTSSCIRCALANWTGSIERCLGYSTCFSCVCLRPETQSLHKLVLLSLRVRSNFASLCRDVDAAPDEAFRDARARVVGGVSKLRKGPSASRAASQSSSAANYLTGSQYLKDEMNPKRASGSYTI